MEKKDIFKESEFKKGAKSIKISLVILGLFLIAQIVGLFIIENGIVPELFRYNGETISPMSMFLNMIVSFVLAITIFFFLIQYKWKSLLKVWFALVILLTLAISINTFFYMNHLEGNQYFLYSLLIALPFVLLKIFRPSIIIHNFTEIFIYSGLSLVFVNILSPVYIILILILISFYDMWAVWHSGIMQKMAKFQMNEIKIFNGFLIPHLTPELRKKLEESKKKKKRLKIKVPIALLGGGDIAFTMIPAGVFLKSFGWILALFVVFGGLLGLIYLMFNSNKKRFYPAMPFITLGIFLMMGIYFLLIHFVLL
jgi:presenilin-like A22 family membrane protease